MKSIEDTFHQICKKQEDVITYGQFCKFDQKLKDHFINELA